MDPATGGVLISGLKALHDMVKTNKDPAATMTKLLEIQSEVFELMNENQELKAENAGLKGKLAEKEHVELRTDGAIWRKGERASGSFAGFCPNCHSDKGKLNKLAIYIDEDSHYRICTICNFRTDGPWE